MPREARADRGAGPLVTLLGRQTPYAHQVINFAAPARRGPGVPGGPDRPWRPPSSRRRFPPPWAWPGQPRRRPRRPRPRSPCSPPGADNGNGDIFISPFGDTSSYANGAEIINNAGHVIWFHPVPAGQEAADFRTQTYLGHPVLTWWQGTGLGGLSSGTDYIYNDHYQQIATVQAGNGYSADGHEFLITPWNTALILRLHHRYRQPDLHRRPGGPGESSTGSSRRSTSGPARCCSSGTAPTTSPTARASSRCPPRPAPRGTGSTSTRCTWTPTATC